MCDSERPESLVFLEKQIEQIYNLSNSNCHNNIFLLVNTRNKAISKSFEERLLKLTERFSLTRNCFNLHEDVSQLNGKFNKFVAKTLSAKTKNSNFSSKSKNFSGKFEDKNFIKERRALI